MEIKERSELFVSKVLNPTSFPTICKDTNSILFVLGQRTGQKRFFFSLRALCIHQNNAEIFMIRSPLFSLSATCRVRNQSWAACLLYALLVWPWPTFFYPVHMTLSASCLKCRIKRYA